MSIVYTSKQPSSVGFHTVSYHTMTHTDSTLEALNESLIYYQTLQSSVIDLASKLISQIQKESINLIKIANSQLSKIEDLINQAQQNTLPPEKIPPIPATKDISILFASLQHELSAFFSIRTFLEPQNIASLTTIPDEFKGILLLAQISKDSVNEFIYPVPAVTEFSVNHYQTSSTSSIFFKYPYSILKTPCIVDTVNNKLLSLSATNLSSHDFFFVIAGSKKFAAANPQAQSSCNLCKKKYDGYFQCSYCLSDVCIECTEWMSSKTANSIGLLCSRNHVLRMTDRAEELYITLNYNNRGTFLCDGCLVKKTGISAQCKKCKIDYCSICMEKLKAITNDEIKIHCRNRLNNGFFGAITANYVICKQIMKWKYNDVKFKCRNCKKFFNKSGSMSCGFCNRKYCISCSYDLKDSLGLSIISNTSS